MALLVTIFVLATKTDVQPNFVSGGHLFALDQKMNVKTNFMCLSCEWEFNELLLEAHAKFQTNPLGYARVTAQAPTVAPG